MQLISWTVGAALISAVLFGGGAVYAVRQHKYRPHTTRLAILYALLGAAWSVEQLLSLAGLLDFLDPDFQTRIPLYGLVILAVVLLLLTHKLLGAGDPTWAWLAAAVAALALPAAIEAGWISIQETFIVGSLTLSRGVIIAGLLLVEWAIFIGAAALATERASRQSARYATLVSYWAIVLTLCVVGNSLYFAGQIFPGIVISTLAGLLAIYVAGALRMPDITHILRQGLSRIAYTGSAVIAYGLFFWAAYYLLHGRVQYEILWTGLAAGLALAILIDPVMNRLRKRLRRWSMGSPQDTAGLLRQYSQSITSILDLNLLATVAVGTAGEILDVKHGYVFLVDHEKDEDGHNQFQIRGVKGMGDTNPTPGKLHEDSPLANFFRYEYRPITQREIRDQGRFKEMVDDEIAWLDKLGADVMVPIYAKNEWIGLMALGSKGSGREYSARELGFLSTIADQTAVALENIRLVEGLVRLNNDFRRAYSALDQANRNLERLDRTKSDFISISSHELRTPLTLISGASQMLLDDPDLQKNPYYNQLLSKMHTGTVRLHEIVDSMLDMAKIDTRALDLEPQPVSLHNLIRGVCNDLRVDIEERKQILDIQNLDEMPSVPADMPALRKVFYHIIVNAIKYTPDEGKITISGRLVEPNPNDLRNGAVEVLISDTGIGIDPRFHDLIFTKFYQTGELALHSTGKSKFKGGGPGLGLAIARGIVEAHHGKIWVESTGYSEDNCPGSSFHVVLPLRPM
jgi:signal transduction histidine kinase